jgi:ABC-2 type transport system ATP-binding protein
VELTPLEQLTYFAQLRGLKGPRTQAEEALRRAGVSEQERARPIAHLSKGYRQRVGLALALLGSPPVLILDEPTDGLDPAQRSEVRSLIRSLSERCTVLISTHVLPEAQEVCSRVLVLHRGSIAVELDAKANDLEAEFLKVTGA